MPPESPRSSKENFCGEAAMIVLLTGESGCGKTTLCARVVATLKARGLDVAGVLTLPRLANGAKVGMEVEDVRTGQRSTLAERAANGKGTADLAWKFQPAALEQGTQILRNAPPCDVLVVDELGPLELIHNEGWIVALDVLQTGHYRAALVVVRPGLVENLRTRMECPHVRIFFVTSSNREELVNQIVHILDPRTSANLRESK
jgi:nucleoside-triphosphatase